ncbi:MULTISPECIES: hypothetical protein [unclassified Streptomyces]|nr:hypothetical protein OG395_50375 [Streptomyces sp. NBC_01320]
MTTDDVAAANLRGLELRETACGPGREDAGLLDALWPRPTPPPSGR